MTGSEIAVLVFSSSVIATLVTIGGNQLLAQLQFKRDYFKEIIAKRLRAYERVDELIERLRGTTYDDSGRIAHVVFVNKAVRDSTAMLAATGLGFGLYLSEAINKAISDLNLLLLKCPEDATDKQAFDIGVAHREEISALRQRLEHGVSTDLLELHRVRRFLKRKRKQAAKSPTLFLAWLPAHGAFSFKNKEQG